MLSLIEKLLINFLILFYSSFWIWFIFNVFKKLNFLQHKMNVSKLCKFLSFFHKEKRLFNWNEFSLLSLIHALILANAFQQFGFPSIFSTSSSFRIIIKCWNNLTCEKVVEISRKSIEMGIFLLLSKKEPASSSFSLFVDCSWKEKGTDNERKQKISE